MEAGWCFLSLIYFVFVIRSVEQLPPPPPPSVLIIRRDCEILFCTGTIYYTIEMLNKKFIRGFVYFFLAWVFWQGLATNGTSISVVLWINCVSEQNAWCRHWMIYSGSGSCLLSYSGSSSGSDPKTRSSKKYKKFQVYVIGQCLGIHSRIDSWAP